MTVPSGRLQTDLTKLMMKDFKVEMKNDEIKEFFVYFHGPKDSPYYGGVWQVAVSLTDYYPYDPPDIVFETIIYHPNIEESSGAICLDVLKAKWEPVFDLVLVFEWFLPQLLLRPNPFDPFNENAASLMMEDQYAYERKVQELCERYCESYTKPEDMDAATEEKSSNEELSKDESDSSK